MKHREHRFADYLLDEIGQIEDRYVAEAQTPYQAVQRTLALRRVLIVALSLALLLTALLSVLLIGSLRGAKASDDAVQNDEPEYAQTTVLNQAASSTSAPSLSLRLEGLRTATEQLQTPKESLDLFDGQAKVIWKYRGEESYRVCVLSAEEYERLTEALDTAEKDTAAESRSLEGIWLAQGDGTVFSPCLKQTDGNVGYGTIFTYDPETEPSAAFTDLLCGILSSVGTPNGKDSRS